MRILAEWRRWVGHEHQTGAATAADGLRFYAHLQENYPDLLSFKHSGDKWDLVKGWLSGAGLIKLV